MNELTPELSKKRLFHLETVKSEGARPIEIWKLQPEYWVKLPYFELKNPSRAQLAMFEDLLLGINQETGKPIPLEKNPLVQFLNAQRGVTPRDGLSTDKFIEPGDSKHFEPNDRGTYFQLDFRREQEPIGAKLVDGGPESVQPGTNGFRQLSRDTDMEIPDQEIRINKLHPDIQFSQPTPFVVTDSRPGAGEASPRAEPNYVDVDSINDRAFRRGIGVRNAQAEKALHIVHEFGHLIEDEGPLAERSPLPGHIIPYQCILDDRAQKVEKSDVLADPVERFAFEVGRVYGYISNENLYLKSRVAAYQEKLDANNIRNADDLRKYLGSDARQSSDKAAKPPAPAERSTGNEISEPISATMIDSAKTRLVVSNGTIKLQSLVNDDWQDVSSQPAGKVRAGLYSLNQATLADPAKSYEGMTLYADDRYVYQKVGAAVIKHGRGDFSEVPNPGDWQRIAYANSQAQVTDVPAPTLGKTLAR